jgi:NAD(P)-dependent dehydrogenase (short-subunit alcohol dehydrogenase family)
MGTGWLRDRVAVVTGASRGIGLACARSLAHAGAQVVLAARTDDKLTQAAAALVAEGCEARAVTTDVSDEAAVDRLFASADEIGPLSVLVCAAGILEKDLISDTTTEIWERTLAVNLTGTFLCAHRAFRTMRDHGGGRIVTIGSLSGVYATEKFPGLGAYNVSKNGIVGLTESLAVEGREHGISAVCVSPGAVDTEMLRAAAPHLNPGLVPDDVGRLVVALLDEDLAPVSGANIPLFSNR